MPKHKIRVSEVGITAQEDSGLVHLMEFSYRAHTYCVTRWADGTLDLEIEVEEDHDGESITIMQVFAHAEITWYTNSVYKMYYREDLISSWQAQVSDRVNDRLFAAFAEAMRQTGWQKYDRHNEWKENSSE